MLKFSSALLLVALAEAWTPIQPSGGWAPAPAPAPSQPSGGWAPAPTPTPTRPTGWSPTAPTRPTSGGWAPAPTAPSGGWSPIAPTRPTGGWAPAPAPTNPWAPAPGPTNPWNTQPVDPWSGNAPNSGWFNQWQQYSPPQIQYRPAVTGTTKYAECEIRDDEGNVEFLFEFGQASG